MCRDGFGVMAPRDVGSGKKRRTLMMFPGYKGFSIGDKLQKIAPTGVLGRYSDAAESGSVMGDIPAMTIISQ